MIWYGRLPQRTRRRRPRICALERREEDHRVEVDRAARPLRGSSELAAHPALRRKRRARGAGARSRSRSTAVTWRALARSGSVRAPRPAPSSSTFAARRAPRPGRTVLARSPRTDPSSETRKFCPKLFFGKRDASRRRARASIIVVAERPCRSPSSSRGRRSPGRSGQRSSGAGERDRSRVRRGGPHPPINAPRLGAGGEGARGSVGPRPHRVVGRTPEGACAAPARLDASRSRPARGPPRPPPRATVPGSRAASSAITGTPTLCLERGGASSGPPRGAPSGAFDRTAAMGIPFAPGPRRSTRRRRSGRDLWAASFSSAAAIAVVGPLALAVRREEGPRSRTRPE